MFDSIVRALRFLVLACALATSASAQDVHLRFPAYGEVLVLSVDVTAGTATDVHGNVYPASASGDDVVIDLPLPMGKVTLVRLNTKDETGRIDDRYGPDAGTWETIELASRVRLAPAPSSERASDGARVAAFARCARTPAIASCRAT